MNAEQAESPDPLRTAYRRAGAVLFCYGPLLAFATGELPVTDIVIFPILAVFVFRERAIALYVALFILAINLLSAAGGTLVSYRAEGTIATVWAVPAIISLVWIVAIAVYTIRIRSMASAAG